MSNGEYDWLNCEYLPPKVSCHFLKQQEALQVCYARGELDNEGIKGYLPEKRGRITFGERATRLHLEE
jgi:hypothetical protein